MYINSAKCQRIVKNTDHSFAESKVTSSKCFFCPTNSPKPKDFSMIIMNNNPHI